MQSGIVYGYLRGKKEKNDLSVAWMCTSVGGHASDFYLRICTTRGGRRVFYFLFFSFFTLHSTWLDNESILTKIGLIR